MVSDTSSSSSSDDEKRSVNVMANGKTSKHPVNSKPVGEILSAACTSLGLDPRKAQFQYQKKHKLGSDSTETISASETKKLHKLKVKMQNQAYTFTAVN